MDEQQNYYPSDRTLKVKHYKRNYIGTGFLSAILAVGLVLFLARYYMLVIMLPSSWAFLGKYFIPPVQYIVFILWLVTGPDEHSDSMCCFGQFAVPLACYAFSAFILYMSWKNDSMAELAFYIIVTVIQTIYLLPEMGATRILRSFVRRPEKDIQAERDEKIRNYKPKQ